MGRVKPSPGWVGQVRPSFFVKKKTFLEFYKFHAYFYVILINIKQYFFMLLKIQNPILKYSVFVKTSKIQKKMFYAYGQVSQS